MPRISGEFSFTHRSFHGFFVTDDLTRQGNLNWYSNTYTLTAPSDSRLADGGGVPGGQVYVPTAAANPVAPQRFLMREEDLGATRTSVWDGFEITVNARLRGGLTAPVGSSTGRAKVDTCAVDALYNQVGAAALSPVRTPAAATTSSRG